MHRFGKPGVGVFLPVKRFQVALAVLVAVVNNSRLARFALAGFPFAFSNRHLVLRLVRYYSRKPAYLAGDSFV